MRRMLVKFKHIEDISEMGCIQSAQPNDAIETLKMAKLVDSIRIGNCYYTYVCSEFVPASCDDMLDVVNIYIEGYSSDDDNDTEFYLN